MDERLFNIKKNSAFIAVLHSTPQLSIYSKNKYPLSLVKLGPISKLDPKKLLKLQISWKNS
jgi:DNA polymerase/3'-5' exonuclease PolX